MGILIPEHFPLSSLANAEERMVVEALRDRLSDGWIVLPDVGLAGRRDHQMDIVIAHPRDGVAVIEVKGHRVKVDRGVWVCDGRALDPQPLVQAKNNAYALRERLRALPGLEHIRIEYAVALPNIDSFTGALPPDVRPEQVFTNAALEAPQDAVELLMSRWGGAIGDTGLEHLVRLLRPDAEFRFDSQARARHARQRLEAICADQVRALERLDANRRVIVTGGAGSGKTRLAMAWARRAFVRGERVLLTCYNDPLAGEMRARLPDDPLLTVGSFFDVALTLEGMPELEIPDDADKQWWDEVAVGHLHLHFHEVAPRFDTIVVDEAQDFSPSWIAQLGQLLDPAGPRRMLMVADETQSVYRRGFALPSPDDGWTRCELVNNCRNTFEIARLLWLRLGGAPAPVGGPESLGVGWVEANDLDTLVELVGEEVDRLTDHEGHSPQRVLVATFHTDVRDALRERLAYVAWEQGCDTAIICENVHRVKGLEFDAVVLVSPDNAMSDALLYVGASRAVSALTVVGPRALADRLGLVP